MNTFHVKNSLTNNLLKSIPNLVLGILFVLSVTSKAWFQENFSFNTQSIAISLLSLLMIINNKDLINYIWSIFDLREKSLDFFLFLAIGIYFVCEKNLSIYALSFLSLYVLYSSISDKSKSLQIIIFPIFIVSLISLLGVYGGALEYFIGSSQQLHKLKEMDYPQDLLFFMPFHSSGIQYTYNGSAYLIMCALGFVNILNISKFHSMILQTLVYVGLILTQAKVGLLFMSLLTILQLFKNQSDVSRLFFICLICCGYLFLSHIIMINQNYIISSDKYFREYLFNFGGIDFYLSLFSWLKIQMFEYLFSITSINTNIVDFVNISDGFEPHFMYGSALLFGGIFFSLILFLKVVSNVFSTIKAMLNQDIYFVVLVLTLFIESFVWDSYDSPVFWGIIIFAATYKRVMLASKNRTSNFLNN